jgi:hypothetical protein
MVRVVGFLLLAYCGGIGALIVVVAVLGPWMEEHDVPALVKRVAWLIADATGSTISPVEVEAARSIGFGLGWALCGGLLFWPLYLWSHRLRIGAPIAALGYLLLSIPTGLLAAPAAVVQAYFIPIRAAGDHFLQAVMAVFAAGYATIAVVAWSTTVGLIRASWRRVRRPQLRQALVDRLGHLRVRSRWQRRLRSLVGTPRSKELERRAVLWRAGSLIGYGLVLLGLIRFSVGALLVIRGLTMTITDKDASRKETANTVFAVGAWLAPHPMLFLLLAPVASYLAIRARRARALSVTELCQRDLRAPVLLLRSFRDDDVRVSSWRSRLLRGRTTLRFFGEYLEHIVQAEALLHGPLIAMGEPGEKLPRWGAARDYVESKEQAPLLPVRVDEGDDLPVGTEAAWKIRVLQLMERAAALVVIADGSANLAWEMDQAADRGLLSRAVVIVPPIDGSFVESRVRNLAGRIENRELRHGLQSVVGCRDVVAFRAIGNGTYETFRCPFRSAQVYELVVATALERICGPAPSGTGVES